MENLKTSLEQVKEFHHHFGDNVHEGKPSLDVDVISDERLHLRLELIAEEFIELVEAVYGKQASDAVEAGWNSAKFLDNGKRTEVVEAADALGDMIYVINGMALETGIPLDLIVNEVHASNMSKLDENGKAIRRSDSKILKGKKFFEPDLKAIMNGEEPDRTPMLERKN